MYRLEYGTCISNSKFLEAEAAEAAGDGEVALPEGDGGAVAADGGAGDLVVGVVEDEGERPHLDLNLGVEMIVLTLGRSLLKKVCML